jgi:hypothetical protein
MGRIYGEFSEDKIRNWDKICAMQYNQDRVQTPPVVKTDTGAMRQAVMTLLHHSTLSHRNQSAVILSWNRSLGAVQSRPVMLN